MGESRAGCIRAPPASESFQLFSSSQKPCTAGHLPLYLPLENRESRDEDGRLFRGAVKWMNLTAPGALLYLVRVSMQRSRKVRHSRS
ncbi:hypothetical protein P3T23_009442 [Paraburkholderia sp. GAS448]